MIATPHPLASEAGAQVLRDGGNAVDAAICADAVLCVCLPDMTSIGGDLFAQVWPAGRERPLVLMGGGRSGADATIERVRGMGLDALPSRGPLSITVPGTVEAWGRLLERFGSLGLAPLLEPAAALADSVYPVSPVLAADLSANADWLCLEPAAWRLWPPVSAGMVLRNPALAAVLREIGQRGVGRFYQGEVAEAIVDTVRAGGGFLTMADLAGHRSSWCDPLEVSFRGATVYEPPPPTQGCVAAGLLARLDRHPAEEIADGLGLARALALAVAVVDSLRPRLADPEVVPVDVGPFLDPDDEGDGEPGTPLEGDTIALSVADEEGTLVSMVQSVAGAFGSGVVARDTGILLHNRGSGFRLDPSAPNRLEPRKRPAHTLAPAMAALARSRRLAFGTMGGEAQPQIQVQILRGMLDRGLDPQAAIALSRLRTAAPPASLWVEADHPDAREVLRGVPGATPLAPGDLRLGHAQAVLASADGSWSGGVDPRADGLVVEV